MLRLPPSVFKIPSDKLRAGYYTDRYFLRTLQVLKASRLFLEVGYQFFPREDALVCGLDEAIAVLKTCAGEYRDAGAAQKLYRRLRYVQWQLQAASARPNGKAILRWERERTRVRQKLNGLWKNGWDRLKVRALYDGTNVRAGQTVLAVTGDPRLFVHLETPLLGAIARPTATATAVQRVVRAAQGKQIFFFSARFDHYWVQASDGYAALKAGAFGVSTDANADYWGIESMGTIPHFLIACFGGDTAGAFAAFDRHTPASVNRIALVDWDNDSIRTTRRILEKMIEQHFFVSGVRDEIFCRYAPRLVGAGRGKLWGVRLDTSQKLRDASVKGWGTHARGVCPELVRNVRKAFDRWGCRHLKIVASGGFDEDKIRRFDKLKIPVDAYGVGATLLRHKIDITADIVEYQGRPCAKVGRRKGSWSRLPLVR